MSSFINCINELINILHLYLNFMFYTTYLILVNELLLYLYKEKGIILF